MLSLFALRLHLEFPDAADIVFALSRRQLQSSGFHIGIKVLTYCVEGSMFYATRPTEGFYVLFISVSLKVE
jgi:hypothetical protein